jgi:hypothetical protein
MKLSMDKRQRMKILEGEQLLPAIKTNILNYNLSLDELMKIDPDIVGSGSHKLFTKKGWKNIKGKK